MPDDRVDFFISRTGADAAWAEWIAWQLEAADYRVVVQDWDFRPGANFVTEMRRALDRAERTIALYSPAYFNSLYGEDELTAAFIHDEEGKSRLLPVRVEPSEIPRLYRPVVFIDLAGLDAEAARARLLTGVREGRAKPSVEPPFPKVTQASSQPAPRFPTVAPATWRVPRRRNPNFTGRQALLEQLQSFLANGEAVALYGLGGSGKSSVALEYAYRRHIDYDLVWWVRAGTDVEDAESVTDSSLTVVSDLAALARDLDLVAPDDPNLLAAAHEATRWLEGHDRWLVVFDNARALDEIEGHLPRSGTGHLIVTSRNPAWSALGRPLRVEVFDPEQSVAFLIRRTERGEPDAAAEIAAMLGNLPLALEQAAAYVEENGSSLEMYARLARERLEALLGLGRPFGYPASVATTWTLSFRAVEETSPLAAALLRLCAFLAPDAIPLDRLLPVPDLPGLLRDAAADPLTREGAVGILRGYSLVERAGGTVSVHRLVQAVTRDGLDEDEQAAGASVAVSAIAAAFPFDQNDPKSWDPTEALLQHALIAAGHAEAQGAALDTVIDLLNKVGIYLWVRARFGDARAAFERALLIGEATYGPDHPNVATVVNNLGSVLRALGDLAGARAALERALRIDDAAYGPDHPNVAIRVNNLGGVLQDLGDLAGARAAFERALRIDEGAYGPDHPNVARDVNNLGRVLQDLGDLAGARAAFERALRIDEGAYGPDHPYVGRGVNNLGGVLQYLGDLSGARAVFERALRIDEGAYGSDHPNVARDVNNLGSVLQALRDLAGARAAFERALRIDEGAYGSDHPNVARDVNNLGTVLQALGDLAGARAAYERALTIFVRVLGPEHPKTVIVRRNLETLGN